MLKIKNKKGFRAIATVMATFLFFVAVTMPVSAADVHVNTTGWWTNSTNFNTSATPIQDAIDNAVIDGITYIYVEESGTYKGNIWIHKSLRVQTNESVDATIDAMGEDTGVLITAYSTHFTGFTVTNVSKDMGTGISVLDVPPNGVVQIYSNTVELDLVDGSGIAATNSSVSIYANDINITADNLATGISVVGSQANIANNNVNVLVEETAAVPVTNLGSEPEVSGEQVEALSLESTDAAGIYLLNVVDPTVESNTLDVIATNLNETDLVNDTYSAYAFGIDANNCSNPVFYDNEVTVTANATTSIWVEGLNLDGGDGAEVQYNEITTEGQAGEGMQNHGLRVYNSEDALVGENRVTQTSSISNNYYYNDNMLVHGLDVGNCASAQVVNNAVTSTAMGENASVFSYGIYTYSNNEALIEGNTVDIYNQGDYSEIEGLYVEGSDKAQVMDNELDIEVDTYILVDSHGLFVEDFFRAQVIGNNVNIDSQAQYVGDSAGLVVEYCYQSQVAQNNVNFVGENTGAQSLPATATEDTDITVSQIAGPIFGYYGEGSMFAGIAFMESSESDIHDNNVDIDATSNVSSEDIVEPETTGYSGSLMLGMVLLGEDSSAVYNNNIEIQSDLDVESSSEEEFYSLDSNGGALTAGLGIVGLYCTDLQIDNNKVDVYGDAFMNVSSVLTLGTPDLTSESSLLTKLDEQCIGPTYLTLQETASSQDYEVGPMNGLTYAQGSGLAGSIGIATIYCSANITDNEVSSESNFEANIHASDNIEPEAASEGLGLSASIGIVNLAGEVGLPLESNYVSNNVISGNNVNAVGNADITIIAEENELQAEAYSYGGVAGLGLGVASIDENIQITDNTITSSGSSEAGISASEDLEYTEAFSMGGNIGIGLGIAVIADEAAISSNEVNADGDVKTDISASGQSEGPFALGGGAGIGLGVVSVAEWNDITDNTVTTSGDVDGAVIKASEVSAESAGAVGGGIGAGVGILTMSYEDHISGNTAQSSGYANVTVAVETESLLESVSGVAFGAGIGIGITPMSTYSQITENTVEGHGDVDMSLTAIGYRPDTMNISIELGAGIVRGLIPLGLTEESVESSQTLPPLPSLCEIHYNNIAGSDDAGLLSGFFFDFSPVDFEASSYDWMNAQYNWWGDASGPSGFGPGTGDAIYGCGDYEPWLTEPYETVLGEDESYFGFELYSTGMEVDSNDLNGFYRYALNKGWNTMSTPIHLQDSSWNAVSSMGDGLDYEIAYIWNADSQSWEQIVDSSNLEPLDAIYIKMSSYDRVPLAISPNINNPPVKQLESGWNLIGPSYAAAQEGYSLYWDNDMCVYDALVSAETTSNGMRGYTVVISPSVNDHTWVYTIGADSCYEMDLGKGYWVYMENDDELTGFSSTPLQIPYGTIPSLPPMVR